MRASLPFRKKLESLNRSKLFPVIADVREVLTSFEEISKRYSCTAYARIQDGVVPGLTIKIIMFVYIIL